MGYTIQYDHYVHEFDLQLYAEGWFEDGELEPDLVANLLVAGVIVSDDAPAPEVAEEPEADDEADEED